MKTVYFYLYILFFGLLFLQCQKNKKKLPKTKQETQSQIESKIDSIKNKWHQVKTSTINIILAEISRRYRFSACVLVKEEGKTLIKRCYGTTDRYLSDGENMLQNSSSFRLGAISQIFTAQAIQILIEQKKISLEDSLSHFFANIKYKNLKIKHLLNHSSGLPDYQNFFLEKSENLNTYATNRNVIDWIVASSPNLLFEPEDKYEYSATNYVLLGRIVEIVSGIVLVDFCKEYIAKPLEMENFLSILWGEKRAENCVRGFSLDRKKEEEDGFLQYIYGNDGFWASLNDLDKLDELYQNNSFLAEDNFEDVFVASVSNEGKIIPFIKGWQIDISKKLVFQKGKWQAFQTGIWWYYQKNTKIIILSNQNIPYFEDVKVMIENILEGKPYKIPF